jgi:hypothetical protein
MHPLLDHYRDERLWRGYVWVVTAATLSFMVAAALSAILRGTASEAFLNAGIPGFLLILLVFWVYCWTTGVVALFLPFVLVTTLGRLLNWHGPAFYTAACAGFGIVNTVLFLSIAPPMYWIVPDDSTFLERWFLVLPLMLLSGTGAGLTMWYVVGRPRLVG